MSFFSYFCSSARALSTEIVILLAISMTGIAAGVRIAREW